MKTYISRRAKNRQLVVVYGGWGTDENVFVPLCRDDFDFILFYNYSADEALILPEMKTYDRITVIGWSLGVWAAEFFSERTGIKPDVTIAVNGTPVPADDNYGIPVNIFEGTLNNINDYNISKFHLRMFGDKKTLEANCSRIPKRTIKSLQSELRWLYNRIMEHDESRFHWDYAVTSREDRVFPAVNLKDYWNMRKETRHITLPLPHYFFHKWDSYLDFINYVENYSVN